MPAIPALLSTSLIFGFFSLCGFYFIIIQMTQSKAPDRFLEVHKMSSVPLNLTNGVLPLIDDFLRPLISFFVSAFDVPSSPSNPTVVAFVWSFSSAIQLPFVEALRITPDAETSRKSSWWTRIFTRALAFPMIWAILYQRLAGGFILPIWLFCFLQSTTRAAGTSVRRAEGESALVGWWLGHTIPALVLLIPGQPALSAVPAWVAFPILMSVFQGAWLWLRTRIFVNASKEKSGYIPLQLTYASAALFSFMAHTYHVTIPALRDAPSFTPTSSVLLNKLLGLSDALLGFFLAPFMGPDLGLASPDPASTTAASGVAHFVQCDVLIVFSAVWVALLWDLVLRKSQRARASASKLDSTVWFIRMIATLLLGGLVFSPGTATGALLIYRESELERARAEHSGGVSGSYAHERTPLLGATLIRRRMISREKPELRSSTY